jgi:hypothetical protein
VPKPRGRVLYQRDTLVAKSVELLPMLIYQLILDLVLACPRFPDSSNIRHNQSVQRMERGFP